ncbi:peptidoglycan-binding protein [Ruminiclostridium josui]|uniref:peptidoglycan-binding protein n=1 Tax=Ruminiclostridium josui TaxID=1499 RepID=UPI000467329D|nr:peptidoglycan-binding protein [Ruminiclostridium josui]
MPSVKFKYKDEACVYPKLINAVNVLCIAKGKDCFCTSGYRSIDKQKTIAKEVLASNPGSWQREDGFVYSKKGECLAAAYGKSNHCYCIAMDISDSWFKELMNEELIKDGLIKPISYEPWHVQLLEHNGLSLSQKEAIRDSVLKGEKKDMTIKEFQAVTGLTVDGIVGPKTKEKAREMVQICQKILGNYFESAEETVRVTQKNPEIWLKKLKTEEYFPDFVMNIVERMKGERP